MANGNANNDPNAVPPNGGSQGIDKFFDYVPPAICFGLVIGFMAALSTYAGTTSALIGLLFILVGREAMSWFKPEVDDHRDEFFRLIGQISIGLFVGLWIGFIAQLWERASLKTELENFPKSIIELESKENANTKDPSLTAANKRFETLLANLETKIQQPTLRLFSNSTSTLESLANKVKSAADNEDLAEPQQKRLRRFAETLTTANNLSETHDSVCKILKANSQEDLAKQIREVFSAE